jgi:hypothetical protein
VQSHRVSQPCRLGRVAGHGIIAARRRSSSHLHRPRRATSSRVHSGRCFPPLFPNQRFRMEIDDPTRKVLSADRSAPCALYPAIKRSVVCASSVLAILRQTAIGQKPIQAEREQVPRGFGAVDTPGLCRPQMLLMSLSRSRTERRSCRGCAGRLQFGRSKATGRPVPTGRDNVGSCGSETPKQTLQNPRD